MLKPAAESATQERIIIRVSYYESGSKTIPQAAIPVSYTHLDVYKRQELNTVLWQKMGQENRENFQGLTYLRRDLFESEEKEVLLPLPETVYEYMERRKVKVGQDFSFVYDKVHYSMPVSYTHLDVYKRQR